MQIKKLSALKLWKCKCANRASKCVIMR